MTRQSVLRAWGQFQPAWSPAGRFARLSLLDLIFLHVESAAWRGRGPVASGPG